MKKSATRNPDRATRRNAWRASSGLFMAPGVKARRMSWPMFNHAHRVKIKERHFVGRSRYDGAALRKIRQRKVNFLGEVAR